MTEQKSQNPTVFIPRHPWRLRLLVGVLAICLVGGAATFFVARWADRGQRDSLYEVANLIRYSVDPSLVTQLTGQPADTAAPAYAQLRKTFIDLGNATKKIRYIYLMGRRNQQNVFFYLDTQPDRYASADQPPLATPGEVYARPATRFVADFVGESNLLDATVVGDGVAEVAGLGHIALHTPDAPVGSRMTLLLRPEALRMGAEAAALPNRANGRVIESVFLGVSVKLRLQVDGGPELLARLPLRPSERPPASEGETVPLGFAPEDLHVIRRS